MIKQSYYSRNKLKVLARVKKRYELKKESIKQYSREYYYKNKDRHRENMKQWKLANPDRAKKLHADVQARRRAKLRAVKSDGYERLYIFHRFAGICIVCDEDINLELLFPHPDSFTIHHLIPISKGGDNTRNNVAPAHFKCNLMVADKMPIAVKPKVLKA